MPNKFQELYSMIRLSLRLEEENRTAVGRHNIDLSGQQSPYRFPKRRSIQIAEELKE